jgi:hypothetical protein
MTSFPLNVRRINQAASGGSHVTAYEAVVELRETAAGVSIEVASVVPEGADAHLVGRVAEHLRRGVDTVLSREGFGARVIVERLHVHPIDCKPYKFEHYTVDALEQILRECPLTSRCKKNKRGHS